MKKLLLTAIGALAIFTASADFPFLEFTTADGKTQTIATDGLVITTDETTLTAKNTSGATLNLPLADLTALQFVDTEASVATLSADNLNGQIEVYTTAGTTLGTFTSVSDAAQALQPGIYIVKNNTGNSVKIKITRQ